MSQTFTVFDANGDEYQTTYKEYIRSRDWWYKAFRFKEQANFTCKDCGLEEGKSSITLHVHHKHYRTLGRERREDVEVVCDGCHKLRHPKWR